MPIPLLFFLCFMVSPCCICNLIYFNALACFFIAQQKELPSALPLRPPTSAGLCPTGRSGPEATPTGPARVPHTNRLPVIRPTCTRLRSRSDLRSRRRCCCLGRAVLLPSLWDIHDRSCDRS